MNSDFTISLSPTEALVDERIDILITNCKPWEEITLSLVMEDDLQRQWFTETMFIADARGIVNASEQTPADRIYSHGDHMALFSSMDLNLESDLKGPPVFVREVDSPVEVTVTAINQAGDKVSANLVRHQVKKDVKRISVKSEGLIGDLFMPAGDGPFPGVLIAGGAMGGTLWSERGAALLASHGYAALSLTYFGIRHLPPEFVEIPLEYFTAALSWLSAHEKVDEKKLAVFGRSKGAEAMLLVATIAKEIKAVIAYMPPAVAYQGIQVTGPISSAKSSWTYRGNPLPFVPCYQEGSRFSMNTVNRLFELHAANLDNPYIVKAASINIEQIEAPMLLFSAGDDNVWPSEAMAEKMLLRHRTVPSGAHSELLNFPNAGHNLDFPFMPLHLFGGGSVKDNSKASGVSWKHSLAFLNKHLS